MRVRYGGDQPTPHDSVITAGCLDKFNPKLQVGDTQRYYYTEADGGPIDLTKADREKLKFTERIVDGAEEEDHTFTVKELKGKLKAKKVRFPSGAKKAVLQQLCTEKGTPLSEKRVKKEYGWLGKPKGMKQICLERGLLDPKKIGKYGASAPRDAFGNKDNSLSYRYLLSSCEDFINERDSLPSLLRSSGLISTSLPNATPSWPARVSSTRGDSPSPTRMAVEG